jgi:hypothetical protein
MGKINWARVLLGGLAAGAIVLAIDFCVNGLILGSQWQAVLKALGQIQSPSSLIIFIAWAFLAGISTIWLYAAARPRFGSGARTAVITGFAFWIFGFALPTLGLLSFGLFPLHLLLLSALAGAAESILGSLAGGWIYRE